MTCFCKRSRESGSECPLLSTLLQEAREYRGLGLSFQTFTSRCGKCKKFSLKTIKCGPESLCCQCFNPATDAKKIDFETMVLPTQFQKLKPEPLEKRSLEEYLPQFIATFEKRLPEPTVVNLEEEEEENKADKENKENKDEEAELKEQKSGRDSQEKKEDPNAFNWIDLDSSYFIDRGLSELGERISRDDEKFRELRCEVDLSSIELANTRFLKAIYKGVLLFWEVMPPKDGGDCSLFLRAYCPVSNAEVDFAVALKESISLDKRFDYAEVLRSQLKKVRARISGQLDLLERRGAGSEQKFVPFCKKDIEKQLSFLRMNTLLKRMDFLFRKYFEVFELLEVQLQKERKLAELDDEKEPEAECSICLFDSRYSSKIKCERCQIEAHLDCLGLLRYPEDDFVCPKCSDTDTSAKKTCFVCRRSDSMFLSFPKSKQKSVFFHPFCLLSSKKYSPNLSHQPELSKVNQSTPSECLVCKSSAGLTVSCDDCGASHHAFCAFFAGFFFSLEGLKELTYQDFLNNDLKYSFKSYCSSCSRKRADPFRKNGSDLLDFIRANSYLRRSAGDLVFREKHENFKKFLGISEN